MRPCLLLLLTVATVVGATAPGAQARRVAGPWGAARWRPRSLPPFPQPAHRPCILVPAGGRVDGRGGPPADDEQHGPARQGCVPRNGALAAWGVSGRAQGASQAGGGSRPAPQGELPPAARPSRRSVPGSCAASLASSSCACSGSPAAAAASTIEQQQQHALGRPERCSDRPSCCSPSHRTGGGPSCCCVDQARVEPSSTSTRPALGSRSSSSSAWVRPASHRRRSLPPCPSAPAHAGGHAVCRGQGGHRGAVSKHARVCRASGGHGHNGLPNRPRPHLLQRRRHRGRAAAHRLAALAARAAGRGCELAPRLARARSCVCAFLLPVCCPPTMCYTCRLPPFP